MNIDVLTLFPEYMDFILGESIIGRARKAGLINIQFNNIRSFSGDGKGYIDDKPYGSSTGMLIQPEPVYDCYMSVIKKYDKKPSCVFMSPKGRVLTQKIAKEYAEKENIIILCGHYEGIDQRVIDEIVDDEISIGDYVLTGGEMPACIFIDTVSRLVPGVLAEESSYSDESHYNGLLEYPHYTHPYEYHGMKVPDILLSGNPSEIAKWRYERSIDETLRKRPDLLKKTEPTREMLDYLIEKDYSK